MTLVLAHITLDCADALVLSAFWSAALGRPVDDGAAETFATIGYPPTADAPAWLFLQVSEAKIAKNRAHLDFNSTDREAEVARLIDLGATWVGDYDEWGHQWTTLRDVDGNEFCVSSLV